MTVEFLQKIHDPEGLGEFSNEDYLSLLVFAKGLEEEISRLDKVTDEDLASVRLSCLKEVWQKWQDEDDDQKFAEWLYKQGHEA